jgi:hypothetical protein
MNTKANIGIVINLQHHLMEVEDALKGGREHRIPIINNIDTKMESNVWSVIECDSPLWAVRGAWLTLMELGMSNSFNLHVTLMQLDVVRTGLICLEAGLQGKF